MPRIAAVLLVALALLFARSVFAAVVPGLYDTGVDASGAGLPAGSVDAHYIMITSADPVYPGPDARVATGLAGGYWIANTATSQWIAPAVDEDWPAYGTALAAGDYVYRLTFDLTGIDPSTVSVSGSYGADNSAFIVLNGSQVGSGISSYNPLVDFTINSGFVAGINHLDFVVANWVYGGSNPSGLRVQGIHGTGTATTSVESGPSGHAFGLFAPSPNPSRNDARIAFTLAHSTHATLRVLDLSGRAVRTLADGEFGAGRFEATWDGVDASGRTAPAGIYFVTLDAGGHRDAHRMIRIR